MHLSGQLAWRGRFSFNFCNFFKIQHSPFPSPTFSPDPFKRSLAPFWVIPHISSCLPPLTRTQYPSVMPDPAPSSPAVRFLTRLSAFFIAFFFVAYSVDLTWFHLRAAVPKFGAASSSVHRIRVLAIPHNGSKVEFQTDALRPEEDVHCSRSLFPHASQNPCWYVSRHANDPIPM